METIPGNVELGRICQLFSEDLGRIEFSAPLFNALSVDRLIAKRNAFPARKRLL